MTKIVPALLILTLLALPARTQTAVQEQLGLKLEPTKGAVEGLVVDHIERLTRD
jgi:uncharacterized protein (TIGR03435 family)